MSPGTFFQNPTILGLFGLTILALIGLVTFLVKHGAKVQKQHRDEQRDHQDKLLTFAEKSTAALIKVETSVAGNSQLVAENTKSTDKLAETFNAVHLEIVRALGRGTTFMTQGHG